MKTIASAIVVICALAGAVIVFVVAIESLDIAANWLWRKVRR